MASSGRYLSEKELEQIVRAYEAEETDSELQSDESESDDLESAEEIIEDEIESDSEDDLPLEHLKKKALYGKNGHK
ncbi:hypothetical protein ILUMI_13355, partial [Ignelater luminosus]